MADRQPILTNVGHGQPRTWKGVWHPGDAASVPFAQKVVIPLIKRGYLSWADFGIKYDPNADEHNYAQAISLHLNDDLHGKNPKSLAWEQRTNNIGYRVSDVGGGYSAGADESTNAAVSEALRRFQHDNSLGGLDAKHRGAVGLTTLTALNPQQMTPDVSAVLRERQKVLDRQRMTIEADPSVAASLSQMKTFYPWVPAKVLGPLAFDGFGVGDPMTQSLAKAALNDRGNPFWAKNPDLLDKPNLQYRDLAPKAYKIMQDSDAKGIADSTSGVIASATLGNSGGDVLSALGDVGGALKTGLRWVDAGLSSPLEYGTGTFRNIVAGKGLDPMDLTSPTSATQQTRFGIALNEAANGQSPDMGSGFFAGGQVAEQQAANARAAYSVNGHALTFGRGLATLASEVPSVMGVKVVEPGSLGYHILSGAVDLGVALKGDPANSLLSAFGDARKAAKVITAVQAGKNLEKSGLINGVRRTFLPQTAVQWVDSPDGNRVANALGHAEAAGGPSFDQIHSFIPDAETALRLHDAENPTEVKDIFRDVLGTTIRDKPYYPATFKGAVTHPFQYIGYEWRPQLDAHRIFGTRPGNYLDIHDPNQLVTQIDRTMRNAKGASRTIEFDGTTMPITEAMARASHAGAPAIKDVAQKAMENIRQQLMAKGMGEPEATKLTRLWDESDTGYLMDDVTNHAWDFGHARIGGRDEVIPAPLAVVDTLNNSIHLPNARAIKQATSWLAPLHAHGLSGAVSMMDWFYNSLYKPAQLLRIASPLRIMMEEQLAVAGDGFVGALNHPLQYISMVAAHTTGGRKGLEAGVEKARVSFLEHPVAALRGETEVRPIEPFAGGIKEPSFALSAAENARKGGDPVPFGEAMNGGFRGFLDKAEPSRRWSGYKPISRNAEKGSGEVAKGYVDAWAERLWRYTDDPVWKYAGQHTVAETKEWFKTGEGRQYLDYMRPSLQRDPGELASHPAGFDLANGADADHFIDETYRMMRQLTGDDQDLAALLVSRNKIIVNGEEKRLFEMTDRGKSVLSKDGRDLLQSKAEQGIGPNTVYGRDLETVASRKPRLDRATDFLFGTLYERPTNRLMRSPYFRQRYWQRVEELLPYVDKKAAQEILTAGAENEVPEAIAKRLANAAEHAGVGSTRLTSDHVDGLAKGFALDKTKELLYDFTARSQVFDSLRLLFPFGEAWKEVFARWAHITRENPRVIRRAQQGITEAKRAGFFYTDPTSGEEVFAYPGSQAFNKTVTGVDVPIVASANGLNIAGNGLPGIGWGVQIPLQWVKNNQPQVRDLFDHTMLGKVYDDFVAPYGDTPGGDPAGIAFNALLPPWVDKFRRVLDDPSQSRQMAATIGNVEAYLQSTGEYGHPGKGLNDAQMLRLRKDATTAAKQLTMISALGSLGLPSAPQMQWEIMDRDGKLSLLGALKDELSHLTESEKLPPGSPNYVANGQAEFVKRHGLDALGALTPLTEQVRSHPPITKAGAAWAHTHGGVRDKYPDVYGFFAPPDPKGEFDQSFYNELIDRGERGILSPAQRLRYANKRVAFALSDATRDKVAKRFPDGDVPTEVTDAMAADRRQLVKDFPGFDDATYYGRISPDEVIKQITRAANDPSLKNTQQARAIRAYVRIRDKVAARYEDENGNRTGWQSAKGWADVRLALRQDQQGLMKRYPLAAGIFDNVFDSDVKE